MDVGSIGTKERRLKPCLLPASANACVVKRIASESEFLLASFGRKPYQFSMSIYATLWQLRFPKEGDQHLGCEWITVAAQAVPAHVGSPTPGEGYEKGDPYGAFLPPPIRTDGEGGAPYHRAVVIVTEHSLKGTERSGQEYLSPLLVLPGEEYARLTFDALRRRICDALRGNRAPIVMEVLLPDGTHEIYRERPEE